MDVINIKNRLWILLSSKINKFNAKINLYNLMKILKNNIIKLSNA